MDAFDIGVGGILKPFINDQWKPLTFFSRQMHSPETLHNTFDHEILALYLIFRCSHYFLEGHDFVAYLDCKPLTFAFSKMSDL